MALVPQAQAICDATNAIEPIVLCDDTLAEQRLSYGMLLMMAGEPEPVFHVEDRSADGVPVRIFRPSPSPDLPVVVHFHGGGWTIGNVEQYDPIARQIANATNAIVVSVDYRLAPEHRFPAAAEDAYAATVWAVSHAAELGADPNRVAVAGDSAGGNLAAVVPLMARDRGGPPLRFQLLIYPVTDISPTREEYPSKSDNGSGYFLTTEHMEWYRDKYLPAGEDGSAPYISPLRASDLTGLPPALVITAEYDPLRDEGESYARRLSESGVPAEITRSPGMFHGFFGLSTVLDEARAANERAGAALRDALSHAPA
jgi:acetyl esterase